MKKLIKINDYQFVETNDADVISNAQANGLEITDIIEQRYTELTEKEIQDAIESKTIPDNIRPEILSKINSEIQKSTEVLNTNATKKSTSVL